MVGPKITCHRCEERYDQQRARCPGCGDPTAINQMWRDQGGQAPSIPPRAWGWGFAASIVLWLLFASLIVYLTQDG